VWPQREAWYPVSGRGERARGARRVGTMCSKGVLGTMCRNMAGTQGARRGDPHRRLRGEISAEIDEILDEIDDVGPRVRPLAGSSAKNLARFGPQATSRNLTTWGPGGQFVK